MLNVVVFGAGKWGKETIEVLKEMDDVAIKAIVDNNSDLWGTMISDIPVYSMDYIDSEKDTLVIVALNDMAKAKNEIEIYSGHRFAWVIDFLKEKLKYENFEKTEKVAVFIDQRVAYYDRNAGNRSSAAYLDIIHEKYKSVYYLFDDFSPLTFKYIYFYQNKGIRFHLPEAEVTHDSVYKSNLEFLKKKSKDICYVFINRPDVAVEYISYLPDGEECKKVYYGHDIHHIREQREYELTNDPKQWGKIGRYKEIERNIPNYMNMVGYPSVTEIDYMKKYNPNGTYRYFPLWYYDEFPEITDRTESKEITFVGNFKHKPNTDAVKWFFDEIYALLIQNERNVVINIVGSNPTDEIKSYASENIRITGYVTDDELKKIYDNSTVIILPLRFGAGMKGKLLEALYYGKPIVSTSIGIEGLDHIDSIFITDDTQQYADYISLILNLDHAAYRDLCEKSQAYIKGHFSKQNILDALWKK